MSRSVFRTHLQAEQCANRGGLTLTARDVLQHGRERAGSVRAGLSTKKRARARVPDGTHEDEM